MRIIESCAECLYRRQVAQASKSDDIEKREAYIAGVKDIIDHRTEQDCSPYLVSLFGKLHQQIFGDITSYGPLKKEYNDLVLSIEDELEKKITTPEMSAKETLLKALVYARIGNYIDFGAMDNVDTDTFLGLFDKASVSENDRITFERFYQECEQADNFLLLTDNCGEIVIDKLFLRVLKRCFPKLKIRVLVRGSEVLNDATVEDARYAGIDQEGEVISNGTAIAGTIYDRISEEAKNAMDQADVILSKGQGNYESMSGEGRHVYYSFLCKCDLFTSRFQVPKLTGMFVCE